MKRWLWLRLTPMGRFERASAKRYAKMIGLDLPREVRAEQARRLTQSIDRLEGRDS